LVTGVAQGTLTITYTLTNTCGTAVVYHTLTVDPLPSISPVNGDTTVCQGATISLSDNTSGGSWYSSGTGTATVSGTGIVSGVSGGVVAISYATTNSCGSSFAVHNVTVNPLPVVAAISGSPSVCLGSTLALTDATTGGTWSATGGGSVITIGSTGIIATVTTGTATVSYTVTNNCGSNSATSAISVITIPVAGTLTGPDSVCVDSVITLIDGVSGGTWSAITGNTTVNASGIVTGITSGIDTIVYSVTNTCGTATAKYPVYVITTCGEGVPFITQSKESLNIFPNPGKGSFTIHIYSQRQQSADIIITNTLGEKIQQFITTTNTGTQVQLNAPPGIYFVSATINNENITSRIIVE
jgi:hypothetical protein